MIILNLVHVILKMVEGKLNNFDQSSDDVAFNERINGALVCLLGFDEMRKVRQKTENFGDQSERTLFSANFRKAVESI